MLSFIKQNVLLTGGVVVVLLALLYYTMFMSGSSTPPLTVASAVGTTPVSQDLLVTLSNLHTIKLNDAIFSDPVFSSLTDFGVVIQKEPIGRNNPFSSLSPATAVSQQTSSQSGTLRLPATH